MATEKDEFEQLFYFYFPHMSYHILRSDGRIGCRLAFLGMDVEIDDDYQTYDECEEATFRLGKEMLSCYIEDIRSTLDSETASMPDTAKDSDACPEQKENANAADTDKLSSPEAKTDIQSGNDKTSTSNSEAKAMIKKIEGTVLKETTKQTRNDACTLVSMPGSTSDVHAKQVSTLCISYSLPFPEYHFLKEDGVYQCYTTYGDKDYVSAYFYTRNDAKEDICRCIVEDIKAQMDREDKQ